MCMFKGAPKKPEYGPCQERHGLSQMPSQVPFNPNDPKAVAEVLNGLIGFVTVMVPLAQFVSKLGPCLTTPTLP
jgi:hypothetical protein